MAENELTDARLEKCLNHIQTSLNAPKGQFNKFGNYAYRSAEDILGAVKPLLKDTGCLLTLNDEIVEVGGRIYVKATATLQKSQQTITTTAFAREADAKKGMDESQVTGAASSYARKYALNGLFAIDDIKDAETEERKAQNVAANNQYTDAMIVANDAVREAKTLDALEAVWNDNADLKKDKAFIAAVNKRKAEIMKGQQK